MRAVSSHKRCGIVRYFDVPVPFHVPHLLHPTERSVTAREEEASQVDAYITRRKGTHAGVPLTATGAVGRAT